MENLDKPPTTAIASGLIGSTVMGAAAVLGGAVDVNTNSVAHDQARRPSPPSANQGGGFGSIFNLKSVINAVTKSESNPIPTPSTSCAVPSEPINFEYDSGLPQKSVQGIISFCEFMFCLFCFSRFFDEILF